MKQDHYVRHLDLQPTQKLTFFLLTVNMAAEGNAMGSDEDYVMDVYKDPSGAIHLHPTAPQPHKAPQVSRLVVRLNGGDHAISGKTQSHLANGEELVIGRSMDADVWIFEEQASRHHACLSANETDGKLELLRMDMQSSNGTKVNGNAVTEPIILHSGDFIGIGTMTIEVVIGGQGTNPSAVLEPLLLP